MLASRMACPAGMRTYVRMRWSNLTLEAEETAHLPGYRDEAVVRHFEAPDSISTRFYEIRAKSILNRVPEASQMPFRWTINPYRGCTHACSYCLGPETGILMADGRTKAIADLQPGEMIYGSEAVGAYRRLAITTVHDKWSSIKPAYVVVLEDGTEIIASADHRFLTRRGWKYVLGAEQGRHRRPHLTVGSKLLGTGGVVCPLNTTLLSARLLVRDDPRRRAPTNEPVRSFRRHGGSKPYISDSPSPTRKLWTGRALSCRRPGLPRKRESSPPRPATVARCMRSAHTVPTSWK